MKQGLLIDRAVDSVVFFGKMSRGRDVRIQTCFSSSPSFFIIVVSSSTHLNGLSFQCLLARSPSLSLSLSHLVFLSSRRFGNQSYLIAV